MPVLADLVWPDAQRVASDAVLAVPVGATEQHGPHLPLSTDSDLAVALVAALARTRPNVVAAPLVAYGSSGEHAGFAGTVSIGQEAIELLLVELGRSAAATFARLLFVCAHGGNRDAVLRAQRRLRDEGRDALAWFPRWSGDAHAGRLETSLMLAVAPDRVRLELGAAGVTTPIQELLPRLTKEGVRAVSPNGVLGDPVGASAAEGGVLLDDAAQDLVRLVDGWEPLA